MIFYFLKKDIEKLDSQYIKLKGIEKEFSISQIKTLGGLFVPLDRQREGNRGLRHNFKLRIVNGEIERIERVQWCSFF